MKINPDKIRDVIGKGGVTIRSITEETGTTIDIAMMVQLKLLLLIIPQVKKLQNVLMH